MLTAVALGVLFLSCAAWAWKQLEAYTPPAKAWTLEVSRPTGSVASGNSIDLQRIDDSGPIKIGTATVQEFTTAGEDAGTVLLHSVVMSNPEESPLDAKRLEAAGASGPAFVARVQSANRIAKFELVYVQAAAAALILAIGFFVVYKYVGNKRPTVEFLIATDEEMKKVNWSTRKIIIDSTYVVIGATFLIAALIFVADLVLKKALLDQLTR
jgi:preprotein translocase SecE subunit